jgi:electron transfer flavoprotein alpha/beta subunit
MSTRSNLKQKAFFVNEVTVRRAQRALGAATDAEAVRLSGNASRRIGFDLLLRGARSVDSGSELVGALLADPLDLPRVTRAARPTPRSRPP